MTQHPIDRIAEIEERANEYPDVITRIARAGSDNEELNSAMNRLTEIENEHHTDIRFLLSRIRELERDTLSRAEVREAIEGKRSKWTMRHDIEQDEIVRAQYLGRLWALNSLEFALSIDLTQEQNNG